MYSRATTSEMALRVVLPAAGLLDLLWFGIAMVVEGRDGSRVFVVWSAQVRSNEKSGRVPKSNIEKPRLCGAETARELSTSGL